MNDELPCRSSARHPVFMPFGWMVKNGIGQDFIELAYRPKASCFKLVCSYP
jgi:hypothetical protein